MNNRISFVTGTKAQYDALTTKDPDTLYFISDDSAIYKGSDVYSGKIKSVSSGLILDTNGTVSANTITPDDALQLLNDIKAGI